MAGRRPLLTRCARPARPASHTDSLRRVATTPDPERLAPAAVLTLHRTPRACSGRFPGSPWGQKAYLAARCRRPPLPRRQVPRPRVASAGRRKPPLVPAVLRFEPARTGTLLGHPKHPWEGVPPAVCDLSGSVRRERANCHICRLYKERILHVHSTFEDTVKIPFLHFFCYISQTNREAPDLTSEPLPRYALAVWPPGTQCTPHTTKA